MDKERGLKRILGDTNVCDPFFVIAVPFRNASFGVTLGQSSRRCIRGYTSGHDLRDRAISFVGRSNTSATTRRISSLDFDVFSRGRAVELIDSGFDAGDFGVRSLRVCITERCGVA